MIVAYRPVAGFAAVALALGVPSLAVASTPPAEGNEAVVTVVDEGDPTHRVLLTAPVSPGTVADSTTSYDIEMWMVGSGVPLSIDFDATSVSTQTMEVLSVDADGGYTARQTMTTFDHAVTTADGTPTDFQALGMEADSATDFTPLVDLPLLGRYSAAGDLSSLELDPASTHVLTAEQVELIDVFVESGFGMDGFDAMLPAVPVGQDAVWTVSEADNPAAVAAPMQLRFTLVSLKGDDYTIAITIEGDAIEYFESQSESEDTEVTGDMTLAGLMTGSAASRLDVQLTLDMTMDMTFVDDDVAVDIDAVVGIDHTSTTR